MWRMNEFYHHNVDVQIIFFCHNKQIFVLVEILPRDNKTIKLYTVHSLRGTEDIRHAKVE